MSEDVNLKYLVFFILIIFCNITEKSTFLLSVGIPTKEMKGRLLLIISLRFYIKSNRPFISFSRNSDFDLKGRFFCNI